MGRSFSERVNADKKRRQRTSRLSMDLPKKTSSDTNSVIDLTNEDGSEVSIDEKLSHLSHEASLTFSDLDFNALPTTRPESNRRSSVLLERERTINALLHNMAEMRNVIDTLETAQSKSHDELENLKQANEALKLENAKLEEEKATLRSEAEHLTAKVEQWQNSLPSEAGSMSEINPPNLEFSDCEPKQSLQSPQANFEIKSEANLESSSQPENDIVELSNGQKSKREEISAAPQILMWASFGLSAVLVGYISYSRSKI